MFIKFTAAIFRKVHRHIVLIPCRVIIRDILEQHSYCEWHWSIAYLNSLNVNWTDKWSTNQINEFIIKPCKHRAWIKQWSPNANQTMPGCSLNETIVWIQKTWIYKLSWYKLFSYQPQYKLNLPLLMLTAVSACTPQRKGPFTLSIFAAISSEIFYTSDLNIHNSSSRSHPSEEENRNKILQV